MHNQGVVDQAITALADLKGTKKDMLRACARLILDEHNGEPTEDENQMLTELKQLAMASGKEKSLVASMVISGITMAFMHKALAQVQEIPVAQPKDWN